MDKIPRSKPQAEDKSFVIFTVPGFLQALTGAYGRKNRPDRIAGYFIGKIEDQLLSFLKWYHQNRNDWHSLLQNIVLKCTPLFSGTI